MPTLQMREF